MMDAKPGTKQWLAADRDILFVLTPEGRIARENDSGRSPGPRFWLAGCAEGNVLCLAQGLAGEIAAQVEKLAADEPPCIDPETPPLHFERYLALLAGHAPVASHNYGCIYDLPHGLAFDSGARLVGSDSEAGRGLLRHLTDNGLPAGLTEVGFGSAGDLRAPWCAALIDGEIAAVAFAARLGENGAELGIATAKAFRGRGFAAAAVAGWSGLPSLREHRLYYSHNAANLSSRQVTRRLGLRRAGVSLRIY